MKKQITSEMFLLNGLLKTKTSFLLLLIFLSFGASAQVANYVMSNATSSYSSQSGLTNLATGTGNGGTMDDSVFTGIPIGFSFVFNCVTYDSVGVSTNGFIWFGHTNPAKTEYTPISSDTAMDGVIAGFALNVIGGGSSGGQGSPRLSYGNPSAGVFMVEWNGCKKYGGNAGNQTNRWDMQIKLFKTTNVIEIRINDYQYGYSASNIGQVGLRGATNTDFNNIGVNCAGTTWGNPSTTGNTDATTAKMFSCYPGNGTNGVCQQFTYTPAQVAAHSSANPICAGTSITLTGSGATSYTWDNGVTNGVAFIPDSTTTYHVTGTTAGACTDTTAITITVTPVPVVGAIAAFNTICVGDMETLNGTGASSYVWNGGITDGIPFPIAANQAIDTVVGTIGGCSATGYISITINPLPNVVAHATPSTICYGDTVTLTGTGAASYSWSGGETNGVPFVPTASTQYTMLGTDGNQCTNSSFIFLTVNSLPVVTLNLSGIDTVCYNAGTIVLPEMPTGGIYAGAGILGNTFNPTTAGTGIHTITYTYTDTNTCTNTSSSSMYVDICLGVYSLKMDNEQLTVYPNPSTGLYYINIDKAAQVIIYDALGDVIFDKQLPQGNNTINLNDFAKGVYLMKAIDGNHQQSLKVIRE